MDIREFLDEIYQMFCRTTGDEHMFWIVEHVEGSMTWNLYTANAEQEQILLATFYHEVDADFTAGLHGALPDLVRRTHEALDEADRLDEQRDDQEFRIAQLEADSDAMQAQIKDLAQKNEKLLDDLIGAEGRIGALVKRKNDLKQETAELGREVVVLEDQVAQLNWELSKERGE